MRSNSSVQRRLHVAGVLALMAVALLPAASRADFALAPDPSAPGRPALKIDARNDDGTVDTRAAGHPFDAIASFTLNGHVDANGNDVPDGNLRDNVVDLPAGFVGNPRAAPTCTSTQLRSLNQVTATGCPVDSQVGSVHLRLVSGAAPWLYDLPVYNMVPNRGEVAAFGFTVLTVPVRLSAAVRNDGDYGLRVEVAGLNESLAPLDVALRIWGIPADPRHDAERGLYQFGEAGSIYPLARGGLRAGTNPRPFLTLPADCAHGPFTTTMGIRAWQLGSSWLNYQVTTDTGVHGCERLTFAPELSVRPSIRQADAPSDVAVDLDLPQQEEPNGLGTPPLKDATVALPEGMTINPASADGLEACQDTALRLHSTAPMTCPAASKIGTVEATSPALEESLQGEIYLRPQNSSDPESGEMFRIALVLESKERGLSIRLPGSVRADARTGRLVTVFQDNPQLPVSRIRLRFNDGPRAPLATPPTCGTKTTTADLTSWSGQVAHREPSFSIDCSPGLGAFSPSLTAGTRNPRAGAFSPFDLSVAKPDGNSAISGLSMVLPAGLVAELKGNLNTQVGTVSAFAGPGSNPYMLRGPVFLEGAYGDAPFSLRVVVPAKAGPFDLGDVVVRQKIYVNPENAQVTVVSDPIPTIVKGVPVRLQRLDVNIDKSGFMINPTSCAAQEIKGTLASVAGQTAALTNRFQVGECASLGYEPELSMTMTGKGQTKDGSHPALKAHLVPPAGDANTKKTTVTLPLALALDPGNANGLCEPKDAAANKCPATTIVGSAQAQSILPDTLKGPVYFVRGERTDSKGKVRKTLPKLFIPLSANGVTVNVHASSDVQDDRLVTTFDNLPDAPFSSFDLNIDGGKHGILAVSDTNVCAVTNVADAEFGGQNGKTYTSKVTMGTPCALGVVKSSHTSTALKLTVGGLGAGKVSASGNGVTRTSRSLASATTATLALKLSTATRRTLARGRDVKVKVRIAFTAKGQKKAKTATKTVVVHGVKKR